ncbi:hypothetical protein [Campylobacter sp. 19-13652]|uniref:hypothetical protein n=1 Tax=Campylobacter sp. 19-13652 TaxID=2840180 RepID=UPI001C7994D8|nr:hypothetical protein [Campylobacter sp. 19-13652]BCX79952.1 hypothetical protein LBC_14140 [Campylobacter sp. 19-13652]
MSEPANSIMLSSEQATAKAQRKAFNKHLLAYGAKRADFASDGAFNCAFDLFLKMQVASESLKELEKKLGIR